MISFYPTVHTGHQPQGEFWNSRVDIPVEVFQRVDLIRSGLVQSGLGAPEAVNESTLNGIRPLVESVHSPDYLSYLETAYGRWVSAGGDPTGVMPFVFTGRKMDGKPESPLALPGYYAFDMGAWILPGTYAAAAASAQTSVHAAEQLCQGHEAAYALCRPPGHHAGVDFYGGYCYLNNAAIAAEYLRSPARGRRFERLAILDIDLHHGNGTQQIFYQRHEVLVVSLHIDPAIEYPFFAGYASEIGSGAGEGFNLNYPLPGGTSDEDYLSVLDKALEQIARYDPEGLVVSLGVDTFAGDPIGKLALTHSAYPRIGQEIAGLHRPTLFVQEGGYALQHLPDLVGSLLASFEQNAKSS